MYQEFSVPAPIVSGCGAISILGERVKGMGCKKALLVCEKGIEDAGIILKAIESLEASGIAYAIYNGVVADPPDSIVDEAGDIAKKEGVDCIVGIGGGSSLDTAKATAILITNPGPARKYICAPPVAVDTKVPLILIPTTAGTGSECTTVAIISLPVLNVKWSVFVNVTLSIVDPELMLTVPKSVTATTGMDAFAHAAEGMTTILTNPHSDLFAAAAIEKITRNLPVCCEEPNNIEARSELALAASWGGLCINTPIVHVGHALADALSCNLHTPHGQNCALALPEAMTIIAPVVPERMRVIAMSMGIALRGGETGEELGALVADGIRSLMRRIGIKSLKEMGYSRDQIISFAPEVVSNVLSTLCPAKIDEEAAKKLLAAVYDNY